MRNRLIKNQSGKDRAIQGALSAGLLALVASFGASCSLDPVHDGEVKALGGEDPNIPTGQYHRSGQPCTVCHGGEGPAKSVFSVAGTVFYQSFDPANPKVPVPVDQAYVRILTADNANLCFVTNCMGNFYATPERLGSKGLKFPFLVSVQKLSGNNNQPVVAMVGHVGREPSCANCHKDPSFFDSPGHIAVNQNPPNPPVQCPPAVEPDPPYVCPEDFIP